MSVLEWYPRGTLSTFAYARHALVEALHRADTPSHATVIVPAFICRDVLAAVHAVGARAVFYPVDRDLRPVGLGSLGPAHAVLAVDYFGIPQDMAPFLELRARYGTVVIEDNAHGLLGRDDDGRLLGTRGDFGLLSMRKTFHLPDGAALLDNRPGVGTGDIHCVARRGGSLRRRVATLDRSLGVPLMSGARTLVRGARRAIGRTAIPTSGSDDECRLPEAVRISCSSLRVLERIDPEREMRRRRELLDTISAELASIDGVEVLTQRFGPYSSPYGVPFRASAATAATVARRVRRYHVDVMSWPDLPTAVIPDAPDHYRDVWLVNFI